MKKFEILVDEIVNNQHRVVVEANTEDEVENALDYADNCREDFADDYVFRIEKKLTVLEHDSEHFEDVKDCSCEEFYEIS